MSIVFPSDTDLAMGPVNVREVVKDPEKILGVMRGFLCEMKDLLAQCQAITEYNESRSKNVRRCTELSDQLSEHLTDLLCHAETMETVIHEDEKSSLASNRDIDQLQSVHDRLESMTDEDFLHVSDNDLDNEQRLIGFVADELSSKIEELSTFRHRLTEATDSYTSEWDQFRNEVRQYHTEPTSLETRAEHLHELHLARYVGETTGSEESELLFRLVEHHMNQITHRKLQRQLSELQMKEKDLDEEIGALVSTKRLLWRECQELEQCIEENKETNEDNTILRPTAAFSNLLDVIDGKFHPSMTHDLEQCEEESQHGGLYLHKCTTDINIKPEFSDDEETETDDTDTYVRAVEETPSTSTGGYTSGLTHGYTGDLGSRPPIINKDVLGHLEESVSMLPKIRLRQGVRGRVAMSMRIKSSTNKLTTTGSIKNFVFKKRRGSHV